MDEENKVKTVTLPLLCEAKGHQVYVMYLPQLERFGFGCGMCHSFGTSLTHGNKVLEIHEVNSPKGFVRDVRADLMLGMETKAVHQCCPKGHYVMAFEMTHGFGFGCIHCKLYSLSFNWKDKVLEVRVVRELEQHDPNARHLERRPIMEHPIFTRPN